MSDSQDSNTIRTTKYNWTQETFLVADDDNSGRVLLDKLLRRMGARVLLAHDGESALELLKENPEISVAILDLIMPGLSGFDVVSIGTKIRSNVIFIACSADVVRSSKQKCIEHGFYNCLAKPFLPVKLYQLLSEAIELREKMQSG